MVNSARQLRTGSLSDMMKLEFMITGRNGTFMSVNYILIDASITGLRRKFVVKSVIIL
ncbi:hypothetical protein ES708_32239 [subsurface metagenome]